MSNGCISKKKKQKKTDGHVGQYLILGGKVDGTF